MATAMSKKNGAAPKPAPKPAPKKRSRPRKTAAEKEAARKAHQEMIKAMSPRDKLAYACDGTAEKVKRFLKLAGRGAEALTEHVAFDEIRATVTEAFDDLREAINNLPEDYKPKRAGGGGFRRTEYPEGTRLVFKDKYAGSWADMFDVSEPVTSDGMAGTLCVFLQDSDGNSIAVPKAHLEPAATE